MTIYFEVHKLFKMTEGDTDARVSVQKVARHVGQITRAARPLMDRLAQNDQSVDFTGPRPDNFEVTTNLGELRALRKAMVGGGLDGR